MLAGSFVIGNLVRSYDYDGDGFLSLEELMQDRLPDALVGIVGGLASAGALSTLDGALRALPGLMGTFTRLLGLLRQPACTSRMGGNVMHRAIAVHLVACLMALLVIATPARGAATERSLLAEAVVLPGQADAAGDPERESELLLEAHERLRRIVSEHAGGATASQLAGAGVPVVGGEPITLDSVVRRICEVAPGADGLRRRRGHRVRPASSQKQAAPHANLPHAGRRVLTGIDSRARRSTHGDTRGNKL